PAGEVLQQRVRAGDGGAAGDDLRTDDGLDGLGQNLPVVVEVIEQHVARERNGIQPAAQVVQREQRVTERDADVALRRRIGQVPLHPRGDQRLRQRVQQRAGQFEVRLGVLEADRVDLVRHRRGAGGPRHGDLREVAERDVGPDVGGEVVQDAAGVPYVVVQLDLPVVRLDLGGQQVEVDAETLDVLA